MSAHTPGQWVVEPILDRFNVYIAAEACICIARDCTEADALLIAAAPELLAACLAYLADRKEAGCTADSVAVKNMRAALAKAEAA